MQPVEIDAKTLIQRPPAPSNGYVINPYTGCALGCAYCYASFAGRAVGQPVREWGNYLYVKKNAVELARQELADMSDRQRHRPLLLSSTTDPYQGHEVRYQLTRGILSELNAIRYPGLVRILTKSPVVVRDIDLLSSLPRAEVGMTVTTSGDKVSRWLEARAPLAAHRLRCLTKLHDAGIPTFAAVGPLLPHFATDPYPLDELFGQLVEAGVTEVFVEHINLKRYVLERLDPPSWWHYWRSTVCGCATTRSSGTGRCAEPDRWANDARCTVRSAPHRSRATRPPAPRTAAARAPRRSQVREPRAKFRKPRRAGSSRPQPRQARTALTRFVARGSSGRKFQRLVT
ncbi:radical SAM protein [Crossiella sp. CA-258035]|uniref:SPL family radical SAM protein n=1 Tax=Crossiella sp. CA-258035 TaxID=2981138 RepID=UPI0024BC4A46|nr:radical SAM protein [Crossiella sp. CA-258035]WHT23281.1 radical SAM protein [Crossiella sp. CA-258035]